MKISAPYFYLLRAPTSKVTIALFADAKRSETEQLHVYKATLWTFVMTSTYKHHTCSAFGRRCHINHKTTNNPPTQCGGRQAANVITTIPISVWFSGCGRHEGFGARWGI